MEASCGAFLDWARCGDLRALSSVYFCSAEALELTAALVLQAASGTEEATADAAVEVAAEAFKEVQAVIADLPSVRFALTKAEAAVVVGRIIRSAG